MECLKHQKMHQQPQHLKKETEKKGRKPYERDENGKIIRPPNKTTVQNSKNK